MLKKGFLSCLIVSFFLLLFVIPASSADTPYVDFKAVYSFEISGLRIATGVLRGHKEGNNYYVTFTGHTLPLIRIFYDLKETIIDVINTKSGRDVYYESAQIRPKKKKYIHVTFDNATCARVIYTKNNDTRKYLLCSPYGVASPFYVYLFFINHGFEYGRIYRKDIVVSTHIYRALIEPIKEAVINIDKLHRSWGRRKAIEVKIKLLKLNRKGKPSSSRFVKEVKAWISTSIPQLPLIIKSWHIVGLFSARLVDLRIEHGSTPGLSIKKGVISKNLITPCVNDWAF